jgi:protein involved in polysaccharide export with SLBB domain
MRTPATGRLLLVFAGVAMPLLMAGCGSSTVDDAPDLDATEYVQEPVRLETPAYRLRPGDDLAISFLTDPMLDYVTPVTPSGTISIPMSGEVVAEGSTVPELTAAIEEHMSSYLLDPTVSVAIRTIAKEYVFVIGEVDRAGKYELTAGMTVTGALSEAGGLLPSGKPSSVMVVRTAGFDEPVAYQVNMDHIFTASDLSEDMAVANNDVIYVPKSLIGKVNEFVYLFFEQIAPAQLFWLRGYEMARRVDGTTWWWE